MCSHKCTCVHTTLASELATYTSMHDIHDTSFWTVVLLTNRLSFRCKSRVLLLPKLLSYGLHEARVTYHTIEMAHDSWVKTFSLNHRNKEAFKMLAK